jgi:phosphate transport system substrate-binding protein
MAKKRPSLTTNASAMRFHRAIRACLAVPGLFLLCAGALEARAGEPADRLTPAPAASLRITGSSTMCPLIGAIAERFRAVQPGVRIEVQCGGSDRGIKDVREGHAEIGMIARALKGDEKDLFGFPMARDGVSLIVHRDNPLTSLSEAQIAGIFSGEIRAWQPLNGKSAPIAVILREKAKPVSELFEKHFNLSARIRGTVVPGDNPVTIAAVAADPDAIAYVSSGEAERKANSGVAIRVVPVGGVMPTERNVITGNYPLTRPLSLITRDLPAGASKDFINYCLSSKVVDLIVRFDYVPYED